MFDKLIESDSVHADFKGRSRYFLVSSVIVGILFLAAVVASLYAADIDIGAAEFDMARLIAPEVVEAPEPEPEAAPERTASASSSELPRRNSNMQRVTESPEAVPTTVSTVQNTSKARPASDFIIGPGQELDGSAVRGPGKAGNSAGGEPKQGLTDEIAGIAKPTKTNEPPPPVKKPEPQVPQSLGVINGRAIDLPTPPYPPQALAVGIQGNVSVQVLIDEQGRVVTAKAVGGPKLLQASAVNAAKRARFIPTQLSLKPVKATGIIVYKFKRN